jgi:hypothetical protein
MSPERFSFERSAGGLDYLVSRHALFSGDLTGIVRPRLPRTNQRAVAGVSAVSGRT